MDTKQLEADKYGLPLKVGDWIETLPRKHNDRFAGYVVQIHEIHHGYYWTRHPLDTKYLEYYCEDDVIPVTEEEAMLWILSN